MSSSSDSSDEGQASLPAPAHPRTTPAGATPNSIETKSELPAPPDPIVESEQPPTGKVIAPSRAPLTATEQDRRTLVLVASALLVAGFVVMVVVLFLNPDRIVTATAAVFTPITGIVGVIVGHYFRHD